MIQYWLVVDLPLWKIWKSVGMMTFPIYWKIIQMFETTNQNIYIYGVHGVSINGGTPIAGCFISWKITSWGCYRAPGNPGAVCFTVAEGRWYSYPLVNWQFANLNMAIYSGLTHKKWWLSIVFCMFTRGSLTIAYGGPIWSNTIMAIQFKCVIGGSQYAQPLVARKFRRSPFGDVFKWLSYTTPPNESKL